MGVEMLENILILVLALLDSFLAIALIATYVSKKRMKNYGIDNDKIIEADFSLEFQMGYLGSSEVIE